MSSRPNVASFFHRATGARYPAPQHVRPEEYFANERSVVFWSTEAKMVGLSGPISTICTPRNTPIQKLSFNSTKWRPIYTLFRDAIVSRNMFRRITKHETVLFRRHTKHRKSVSAKLRNKFCFALLCLEKREKFGWRLRTHFNDLANKNWFVTFSRVYFVSTYHEIAYISPQPPKMPPKHLKSWKYSTLFRYVSRNKICFVLEYKRKNETDLFRETTKQSMNAKTKQNCVAKHFVSRNILHHREAKHRNKV